MNIIFLPFTCFYLNLFTFAIQIYIIFNNVGQSSPQQIESHKNDNGDEIESPPKILKILKNKREHYALSPIKLPFLAELEQDIYSILFNCNDKNNYELIEDNEHLFEEINMYLIDYEDGTHLPSKNTSVPLDRKTKAFKIASNPLMAYRMLRRFNYYISYIHSELKEAPLTCKCCWEFMGLLRDVKWPTFDDVKDAMDSILRIQAYHNFTSSDLSKGIFGTVKTSGRLSVLSIVEIGIFAAKEINNFVLAIEWLELGLSIMDRMDNFDGSQEYIQEILNHILQTKITHDEFWNDVNRTLTPGLLLFKDTFTPLENKWNYLDKISVIHKRTRVIDEAAKDLDSFVVQVQPESESVSASESEPVLLNTLRYMSLCAGKNYQTAKEKSQLRCWFETKKHPYWTINPLKMELLHPDPPLFQVYDIVGDKFIDKIMTETAPTLKQAEILHVKRLTVEVNQYRTAITGWVNDRSSLHMKSFYKKLRLFTGLNVERQRESENLQVAGYSFGGQYGTHTDCVNEVLSGGYTAFPNLGTVAMPVKGSAVFWYDIFKNGTCDMRFIHGACPVVLGNKFVFNVWIRSHRNFLSRPCDLDQYK